MTKLTRKYLFFKDLMLRAEVLSDSVERASNTHDERSTLVIRSCMEAVHENGDPINVEEYNKQLRSLMNITKDCRLHIRYWLTTMLEKLNEEEEDEDGPYCQGPVMEKTKD